MQDTTSLFTDPREFGELLFRHKWKIVFIPIAVIAMGVAIIFFAPRTYVSEAKVLMRVGRESVGIDPTATTGQFMELQQHGRDSEVRSAVDLWMSRGLVEQVVDQVGAEYVLEGGPADESEPNPIVEAILTPLKNLVSLARSIDKVSDRERAIIEFTKNLEVKSERDSTVIVVSYETDTPDGAQHILATLVELYQREYSKIFRNPQSLAFFSEQTKQLKQQLEDAEKSLRDAKNRMQLASVQGRRSSYESQISAIELSLYQAEQEFASTSAKIRGIRGALSDIPERLVASKTSVPNVGTDLLREQLYALQVKQIDYQARYSDDHPMVKSVSAQVEKAQDIVDQQDGQREETVDDVNPVHRELSLELQRQETLAVGLTARLQALNEQKLLVVSDMKQLNQFEVEIEELNRAVRLASDKYYKYSENLEQARIDEALEDQRISSFSLPQPATFQEKPVSPSKALVGVGALMLAFGGTIAAVVASEGLGGQLRTGKDVERELGLPVFAEVPEGRGHERVLNR
ncbi:Chain length determinant protein [Posidoniimonas polymericola]|uniref:Chain length determinant protein n=1 Tax=Posidoniimonas polymericola TaxID=2528002 RepID=A0A5C5XXL6_9BACT|nr:Wzz/FepE/Etk N-terminal domain-containing protein [Posidoniimonas polymericola]TWT67624.1 Chain length determinant protein [Posidoniimonas polymericola]